MQIEINMIGRATTNDPEYATIAISSASGKVTLWN